MRQQQRLGSLCAGASLLAAAIGCGSAGEQTADEAPAVAVIEPEAMAALERMGAYLRTLQSFAVTAETTRDDVAETGETIEFGSRLDMRARLPDRLRIDATSDRNARQFFYDGKTVVVFAPQVGAYAVIDGARTIRQTLEIMNAGYGMDLPLADLFLWGTEDDDSDLIVDAFSAGMARIGGEACEHFVYRQEGIDWQLWVRTGAAALPCKLVITTTDEESRPRYEATLAWDLDARIADSEFTFVPPADAYEIEAVPATDGAEEGAR